MRIAHIADTHLGYRSNTLLRRDEDFATSWITACHDIVKVKPDLIIHAGDVFHRPNPSWSAVKDFLDGADILGEAKCPILGISGNHDSSRIMTKHNVFTVLGGVVSHVYISYEHIPMIEHLHSLNATVVLLSHQALLNSSLRQNLEYAITQLGDSDYTILVAHGDIANLEKSQEMGSFVIPDFVFEYPWSYIALGHLHLAQPFGQRGWYSGSTERCGWSDYPADPGWTLATLSPTGLKHEQRSVPRMAMIQLEELNCDGEEVDIGTEILRQLDRSAIPDERAVARIKLNGIHLFARRAIQSSLQRLVKLHYPKLVFQVEVESVSSIWNDPLDDPQGKELESIEDMFRDFVETRVFEDPTIATKLLEIGNEALAKVRAAEGNREAL